jgi:hypothetical protein
MPKAGLLGPASFFEGGAMPGLSDAAENTVLDAIFNGTGTTYSGLPTADVFIGLHSGDPGDTGATNELTGGGYVRQQVAFGAAASGTLSNTGAITWSVPAGNVVAWSAWSASSGGTCYATGWFNTATPAVGLGLCRSADLTNNDIQSVAHGLAADDRIVFETIEQLTTPTGISLTTIYFVIATGITTDSFRVSTSSGGAALDITAAGSTLFRRVLVTNFGGAGSFQVAAGDLDIFSTE